MTLTVGRGPFGRGAAGHFDFDPPEHVVYVEEFPRRVRAVSGGVTVVDSDAVKLVHETDRLPHYSFPAEDVKTDAAVPDPAVTGYVSVPWDAADHWYEEDAEVFVHVRDPYHRIDVLPTSRHVQVAVNGAVLADSRRARALYETGLPTRWYLPPEDVRTDLLERSETLTQCAYKGTATHWSARVGGEVVPDVAWSYEGGDVRREAEDVRGYLAFYNERVDLDIDGARMERPRTAWSR